MLLLLLLLPYWEGLPGTPIDDGDADKATAAQVATVVCLFVCCRIHYYVFCLFVVKFITTVSKGGRQAAGVLFSWAARPLQGEREKVRKCERGGRRV